MALAFRLMNFGKPDIFYAKISDDIYCDIGVTFVTIKSRSRSL